MAEMEKTTENVADEVVETAVRNAPVEKKEAAKADKKKDAPKAKSGKPSLGARLGKKWREFKAEFKKIVWSSRRDTFNNTLLVVVSAIIIAVVIGILDFAFSNLLSALGKLI